MKAIGMIIIAQDKAFHQKKKKNYIMLHFVR